MSNRSAYRLLAAIALFGVAFELLLTRGPAVGEEFQGLWQVWHPLYLPLLGLATVPIALFYQFPLSRRLGGRSSAFGRTIWFLTLGMLLYTMVGTVIVFVEITCDAWPFVSCSHPVGYLPHPNWGYVGFLAMYPVVAMGLTALLNGLGTSVKREMVRHWYVPVIVAGIDIALVAPFGADLAFASNQTTMGTAIDAAIVIGGWVVLSLAAVCAINARQLSGGAFARPVAVMLAGFLVLSIGDLIQVNTSGAGRLFDANDPSAAPYTLGFILWIASSLMFGAAIEKMVGAPDKTES